MNRYAWFHIYLTVREVEGHNQTTALYPLTTLKNRAQKSIHRARYGNHTNPLFLQSKVSKLKYCVKQITIYCREI